MKTSYYAFETPDGELHTFDSPIEAVQAASGTADDTGEQIIVYQPGGDVYLTVAPTPTLLDEQTTSGHTPGPWITFPPQPGENEDGEEEGYIHGWLVYSEATNDAICEFATLAGSGHEYDNAETNARIIAALPAMLVLLRRCSAAFSDEPSPLAVDTQALLDSLDTPPETA